MIRGGFVVPFDLEHRRHRSQRVRQLILLSREVFKSYLFEMGKQSQYILLLRNQTWVFRIPLAFDLTEHESRISEDTQKLNP